MTAATSSRRRFFWPACSARDSTSTGEDDNESQLRTWISWLWEEAEWSWHTQGGRNVLYWHWSPNNGWSMNHEIRGWNECLITYVLAASAPRYPIHPDVYHRGFADGRAFRNGREFYGITLPLGPDYGGPLFLAQYSFLGLDPRGLTDRYADYFAAERRAHADQLRALRAQPARLQGLRPRLLGPHLERRSSGLPRARSGPRPRGDHADRRAVVLSLHAGALDARRSGISTTASATASGASTGSSTRSARRTTGTRAPTSRSTRARSS